jgi:uncharacterized protein
MMTAVDVLDTDSSIVIVCGIAMVIGVFGVIVPMLPGLLLCWCSVLVWALFGADGVGRWIVLAATTLIAVAGMLLKYVWPGRNLKRGGVPNITLLAGGVLGLVGFFVIPVVGLVIGFVLGVWLAESARLGDSKRAWPSTKHALKAAGLAMLIELGAALAVAAVWVAGLVTV